MLGVCKCLDQVKKPKKRTRAFLTCFRFFGPDNAIDVALSAESCIKVVFKSDKLYGIVLLLVDALKNSFFRNNELCTFVVGLVSP